LIITTMVGSQRYRYVKASKVEVAIDERRM